MSTDPELKTYTVCAAFYDADSRATVVVQARSIDEACQKAIRMVDDGEVSTTIKSYDPGPTFVHGVVEGDGDPFEGCHLVPREFQEPVLAADLVELDRLVAAARTAVESGRPSTLTPALSRALDALHEALVPFDQTA